MIIAYQDTAEGVYLASGGAADNSDTANNIKCDSQYMNGNWHRIIQAGMEAPEDTDSSSDVWDVRHIQLQPVDSRRIMWIRDMLEVTIPIMETASHPGKRKDMDRMIQ